MKIIFVNPPVWPGTRPVDRVYGCTYALYPIPNIFALGYAATLERAGYVAGFLDAPNEKISVKKFESLIINDSANAYIFHSVNLSQEIDLRAHALIRKIKPDAWIIFSGPAPTDRPDDFLVDEGTIVARGEPDLIIVEIMKVLGEGAGQNELKTIPGISFKTSKENIHNVTAGIIDDLDSLPFPARHLTKANIYHNPKLPREPMTAMITSRQCAFQCIFCVPNSIGFAREIEYKRYVNNGEVVAGNLPKGYGKFIKPAVRKRSAENVIEEFKLLKKQGYRSVSIVDDQFLWEEERTLKICDGIKDLGIQWGCLARADRVSKETAEAMAKAGCRYVDLGIESLNPKTLAYVNKNATVEKMYEGTKLLQNAGIQVKVNMLIGANPDETKQEIWDSIKKVIALKPEIIMFSIVSPFPGTKYYEIAKKEGFMDSGEYHPTSVQHRAITSYKNFSRRDLDRLLWQANASFYFRPDVILRNSWRLLHPRSAYAALMALKEKMLR
jgi:radical SAM superfamily enzyme YgiQ (UPF0313 family)